MQQTLIWMQKENQFKLKRIEVMSQFKGSPLKLIRDEENLRLIEAL